MRLETTISHFRHEQLSTLAAELNVSKSDIVDEALSLLATGILEARVGRRFAIVDPDTKEIVCHVHSPLIAQAEWIAHRERLTLSHREAEAVDTLLANPPKPSPALRKAMSARRRKPAK